MLRTLKVLFRRDPSRDRQEKDIAFEGYEFLWPDGRPVAVGFNAFCKHGQRLLGLGRHLRGCRERMIEVLCIPLRDREDDLSRLPGARVRRFLLKREGRQGRIHFLDGTPTTLIFDLDHDEDRVLHWVGLPDLADGGEQWLDLAARPTDSLTITVAASPAVLHPYSATR
jgi:hypothetical protein